MQTETKKQFSLMDAMKDIHESNYHVHELAAIWIIYPVLMTANGKHARWVIGDKCKIENGELVDFKNHNEETHIITSCKGNIANSVLEFSVMDLITKELQTIKIK